LRDGRAIADGVTEREGNRGRSHPSNKLIVAPAKLFSQKDTLTESDNQPSHYTQKRAELETFRQCAVAFISRTSQAVKVNRVMPGPQSNADSEKDDVEDNPSDKW
jgi:hypothetical protein